ncbi:PPC domain-containing DNA-binding protein [Nocardia sp. 004]|uniref:PPC domain-containing DNA-binding protein n=1 Tax=Nocardia sp. 004 TaxID=3385978 RepID=UPI0039A09260
MRYTQLTIGRTFGIALDHGEEFFAQLTAFCTEHDIRAGYLPMFLGAFRTVHLVGTCEHIDDPEGPVWSAAEYHHVEILGSGTIAWNEETQQVAPHVHVAVGERDHAAAGKTSHLLSGSVQFVNELYLVEILQPAMTRPKLGAYEMPTLQFGQPDAGHETNG